MEYNKKVIVIGDSGVGKTSFVARITEGRLISDYRPTIGVECAVKTLKKPNDVIMRISFWDLAGQDSFKTLMPLYARGSDGIVIICDVSSRTTIDAIRRWKSEADKALVDSPPCILLVNKFDLPKHIHCVSREQLDRLCDECRLSGYYETSVKENINLQIALEELSDLMLKYNKDEEIDEEGIKLDADKRKQREYMEKSHCCE